MANSKQNIKNSKFLSYVLRHKPESIGISLNPQGWANIEELIHKGNATGEINNLNRTQIEEVIDNCDKNRFIISEDGQSIRANQGHSVNVDVQLKQTPPPEILYHGTATRFLKSILQEGLKPQARQYVHLSTDIETAAKVGERYGKPVILTIKALLMHEQGFAFYISENKVWLSPHIPIKYILMP